MLREYFVNFAIKSIVDQSGNRFMQMSSLISKETSTIPFPSRQTLQVPATDRFAKQDTQRLSYLAGSA